MKGKGPCCLDRTISSHDLPHTEVREGLAALNEEVKGSDGLRRCRWGSFLEGSGLSRGYTLIINSLPSYHLYHFFFTHCPSTHLGFITYNISNDPIKFLHKNQLLEIQPMKKQKSMSSSSEIMLEKWGNFGKAKQYMLKSTQCKQISWINSSSKSKLTNSSI